MSANPLDQFILKPIVDLQVGGVDVSFTNSSLYMVIAVSAIILFLTLSMRSRALVPGRWQSLAESVYEFIATTLRETVGEEGRKFFPFIFSLFIFIAVCNLIGMIPGSFTVTSHLSVTFGLAMAVFVLTTIVAFARHGIKFLGFFLPHGTPWWLAPLMIVIELVAYFSRPISLSVRLGANMMVGHMLLKIVAGFVVGMGLLGGWLPLAVMVAFTGFEIFVALLQAYIFTMLTCVYLNDAIHLH
jgi:F-type H+-transporting ATPase subunit a